MAYTNLYVLNKSFWIKKMNAFAKTRDMLASSGIQEVFEYV